MNVAQSAKNLGWLSLALGAAEIFAPKQVGQLMGIGKRTELLPVLGVREVVSGIGILAQSKPTPWVWSRVVGDVMDVGLVAAALPVSGRQRHRVAGTLGVLLAIGVLDLLRARQLQQS